MNKNTFGGFFALVAVAACIGMIIYKKYSSGKRPVNALQMAMLQLQCPKCKETLEEFACADFQENEMFQKVYKCPRCVAEPEKEIFYRSDGQPFLNENTSLHRLQ
ncbi:MAG: hypothetical protein Q8P07_01645 [bacterium]|nr:hypothetical protein [bacterium]